MNNEYIRSTLITTSDLYLQQGGNTNGNVVISDKEGRMMWKPTGNLIPCIQYVQSIDDFPSVDENNDIYLGRDTSYIIVGTIDIGDKRIILDGTSTLSGNSLRVDILTGSSERELIYIPSQSNGFRVYIHSLTLKNNVGGNVLLCEGNSTLGLIFNNIQLELSNIKLESIGSVIFNTCNVNGGSIVVNKITTSISFENCLFFTMLETCIVEIVPEGNVICMAFVRCLFSIFHPSAVGIKLPAQGGNSVNQGEILNCIFKGLGLLSQNFNEKSNNWEFIENSNINSSTYNATSIAFPGDSTPGLVDLPNEQVWTDVRDNDRIVFSPNASIEKFTISDTVNGEITYNGSRTKIFKISGSITHKRATSPNIDVQIGISINGGTPLDSTQVFTWAHSQPRTYTTPISIIKLNQGDTIKLQIRNIDPANPDNNVKVVQAILSIFC